MGVIFGCTFLLSASFFPEIEAIEVIHLLQSAGPSLGREHFNHNGRTWHLSGLPRKKNLEDLLVVDGLVPICREVRISSGSTEAV